MTIDCGKNENGHDRGLHVVVMDPQDGGSAMGRVFDTYKSSEAIDQFIDENEEMPDGNIVICACKDECSKSISEKAKQWLQNCGSLMSPYLKYRCGFAFIGIVERRCECNENLANYKKQTCTVTQIL